MQVSTTGANLQYFSDVTRVQVPDEAREFKYWFSTKQNQRTFKNPENFEKSRRTRRTQNENF